VNILVLLVVFCFFAVLVVVGVLNSADVTVNLWLWHIGPVPMGAVLVTAAIFGVAFTCTIGVLDGIKIRLTNRQLRKQLQRLEEESDALRLQLARHQGPVGGHPSATEG